MRKAILDFLKTERVGVLAVEMPDGSPHAAAVHFAHCEGPFVFYFETNKDYRKSEALFGWAKSHASFVVGIDEAIMKTLQLDGFVEIIKDEEKENFDKVYLGKFPEKIKKVPNPKAIFFKFTPTWWRYSDYKNPEGKLILESENIDVLDEKRNKTGEVRMIDDIHWYGLWHSSARVWIVNSNKEILLQHRHPNSMEFPNMWDVSAAGHVSAGDDSLGTAVIETKEELGLEIDPTDFKLIHTLKKSDVSRDGTYKDNSFEDIYLVKKDIHIDDFKMQHDEVQNLKWVPIDEFKKMVLEKSSELVPHWDEYEFVINELEK